MTDDLEKRLMDLEKKVSDSLGSPGIHSSRRSSSGSGSHSSGSHTSSSHSSRSHTSGAPRTGSHGLGWIIGGLFAGGVFYLGKKMVYSPLKTGLLIFGTLFGTLIMTNYVTSDRPYQTNPIVQTYRQQRSSQTYKIEPNINLENRIKEPLATLIIDILTETNFSIPSKERAIQSIGIYVCDNSRYRSINRREHPEFFKNFDKNKDGKLILEELGGREHLEYELRRIIGKNLECDNDFVVKEFLKSNISESNIQEEPVNDNNGTTKKDISTSSYNEILEKNGEDFYFWNPNFETDKAVRQYNLEELTGNEDNKGVNVVFGRDSIQLYIVTDLKSRLTQFNLPKSSTVKDIIEFYLSKKEEAERAKITSKEAFSEVPYYDTTHQQEEIPNASGILDQETGMPKEFLPNNTEFKPRTNESKIEDPLKIYESLNPNSEFSQETPSNHAPVVIERRDENNNVISQETKYLTREELKESTVTEIEINYPSTGNRYPISREKYPKFYKKLDKNKDGKLDLEELGRDQDKFNRITKKYPEGDVDNIVKEFLKTVK